MWILFILIASMSCFLFLRRREVLGLLLIIFLATSGFQLLPSAWFVSPFLLSKPYDYAYFSTAIILFAKGSALREVIQRSVLARLSIKYLAFIGVVAVYSTLVYSYNFVQIIQSARIFCWPIFLLLFQITKAEDLRRVVNLILPVVIFTSALYILQPITGLTLLNPDSDDWNPVSQVTGFVRYLSTPDFLIFYLLLFAFQIAKGSMNKMRDWSGFLLIVTVQIISFTRSAMVGSIASLAMLWLKIYSTARGVAIVLLMSSLAMLVVMLNPFAAERVSVGVDDIVASLSGDFLDYSIESQATLAFRLGHFYERADYVLSEPARWLFGIGFIHEESPDAANLGFRTGIFDLQKGSIIQVDTGDIVWSLVILKTGVAGVMVLLWFLIASYRAARNSQGRFALVYQSALIYYVITSFFSTGLASPSLMMQLMLFLALAECEYLGVNRSLLS